MSTAKTNAPASGLPVSPFLSTTCRACETTHDARAFERLPFKGTETIDGSLFEFRRCACGAYVRLYRGPALGLIA